MKPLKDPRGGTFPGNKIPASRFNQASLNFLNTFVPLPNSPGGLYSFANQQAIDDDQVVAKLDRNFGSRNQLSGRFLWETNDTSQVVSATTIPGFLALIQYQNWNVAVNDTHTFSPRLVNVFTFGFDHITREQLPIIPEQKTWGDLGAGIVRAAPGPIGYDTQVSGYFNAQSRYLLNQNRKTVQYSDGLSYTTGPHALKFGGDIRQSMVDQNQTFQSDPQIIFRSTFTGDAASDFLLGRPTTITEQSPNAGRPRTLELDAYLQDDWKVNRRLTLNLGLRWDPFLPFRDLDNQLAQVRLGQHSTVYPTAPSGYLFPGDPGVSSTTLSTQWQNWAPRFGFAYDIFGNGRASLRGGYGTFFSDVRQQSMNQLSTNQPFAVRQVINSPSGGLTTPYSDTATLFPYLPPAKGQNSSVTFFLPLTVTQWDPNFRNSIVQQWNLSVQKQIGSEWVMTAAYVGSKGNHLFIQNEINPAIYGASGRTTDTRRALYPTYSSVTDYLSVGNSTYHALQVTANKRMSHGFTLLANYTWSKSLDTLSDDTQTPTNPFNIARDKGPSDYDIPHRFVSSLIWMLPSLASRSSLLRTVAGGWEVNGIVTLASGTPFTLLSGVDNSQSAVNKDRADQIGNWQISGDRSKNAIINQYFNTASFTTNALAAFGNTGRNVLRGPGTTNVDFGAIKSFHIHESWKAQLRAESFNLFNTTKFSNPNSTVSSATFGRITGAGNPRVIQIALKLIF